MSFGFFAGGAKPMFRDRADAAVRLAERLRDMALHEPVVLGIPRGGVVLGAELTRALSAELDVVLARKLRAPYQPELAIGAVSEDGEVHLNPAYGHIPGVTDEYLEHERQVQMEQIAQRRDRVRAVRPAAELRDRSVMITDDGIATGSTMIASLQSARAQQPRELICAVPVGPPDRLEEVGKYCDRVVCVHSPRNFWAISQCYERFEAVEDDQVVALLKERWNAHEQLRE